MATKREKEKTQAKKTNARDWAKQQSRFESTCVKLPPNVDNYKLEVGTHDVDFMPYRAGGLNKRADEGFEHFEFEYAAHRVPGPDGKSRLYPCLWEVFKEPCPICRTANSRDTEPELAKSLRAKTRNLWIVNDKPGDKKNPPKILDVSHYNRGTGFGELMADAINDLPDDVASISDLEGGVTARLVIKEQTMPGNKFNAVTRITFRKRDYDYPEDIVDKMPCLDDCILHPTAAELTALIDGEPPPRGDEDKTPSKEKDDNGEDDNDDKPAKARKPAADDDEEDDEDDKPVKGKGTKEKTAEDLGIEVGMVVEHRKHGECEVIKVSRDGTSLTLEDEDGDEHLACNPNDCKVVETADKKGKPAPDDEDDEDDAPRGKKVKAAAPDDDEDDDEPVKSKGGKKPPVEDDDEDDELAPKSKGRKPVVDDDDEDDD